MKKTKRKDARLHIRMTTEHKKEIMEMKNNIGISLDDLIYQLIGSIGIVNIDVSILNKTLIELNRMGTNLNQQTKVLHLLKKNNEINKFDSQKNIDIISSCTAAINTNLNELKKISDELSKIRRK